MPLAIGQVPFCHHFDDDGDNHVMGVLVLIVGDSEDTKLTNFKKSIVVSSHHKANISHTNI